MNMYCSNYLIIVFFFFYVFGFVAPLSPWRWSWFVFQCGEILLYDSLMAIDLLWSFSL